MPRHFMRLKDKSVEATSRLPQEKSQSSPKLSILTLNQSLNKSLEEYNFKVRQVNLEREARKTMVRHKDVERLRNARAKEKGDNSSRVRSVSNSKLNDQEHPNPADHRCLCTNSYNSIQVLQGVSSKAEYSDEKALGEHSPGYVDESSRLTKLPRLCEQRNDSQKKTVFQRKPQKKYKPIRFPNKLDKSHNPRETESDESQSVWEEFVSPYENLAGLMPNSTMKLENNGVAVGIKPVL